MEVSLEKSVQQETVALNGTWASFGQIDLDGADESATLDALSILEYLKAYGDIVSTGTIISISDPLVYSSNLLKRHPKKIQEN